MIQNSRKWDIEEITFLFENETLSHKEVAEILNRGVAAVETKCYKLGIIKRVINKWDIEELTFLFESTALTHKEIGEILGRSIFSVGRKCDTLKIVKETYLTATPGSVYSRLTVIGPSIKNKWGNRTVPCRCICGKEKMVEVSNLNNGDTVSCGCYGREASSLVNRINFHETILNRLESAYRGSAKSKSQKYSLTKKEFRELVSQNCHYCGMAPRLLKWAQTILSNYVVSRKDDSGDMYANGIDRVDNHKGYFVGNVVPCCTDCNTAKMDKTYDEFIRYIKRISGFLFKKS